MRKKMVNKEAENLVCEKIDNEKKREKKTLKTSPFQEEEKIYICYFFSAFVLRLPSWTFYDDDVVVVSL